MLEVNDIVRSKKQNKVVIPYLITAIEGENAKCVNLIDTYDYTIPLVDLYLWIVQGNSLTEDKSRKEAIREWANKACDRNDEALKKLND